MPRMRSAKRTPAPAPDCVCPGTEGAEQRKPAMVDTMTAALREMRDRLDRCPAPPAGLQGVTTSQHFAGR